MEFFKEIYSQIDPSEMMFFTKKGIPVYALMIGVTWLLILIKNGFGDMKDLAGKTIFLLSLFGVVISATLSVLLRHSFFSYLFLIPAITMILFFHAMEKKQFTRS